MMPKFSIPGLMRLIAFAAVYLSIYRMMLPEPGDALIAVHLFLSLLILFPATFAFQILLSVWIFLRLLGDQVFFGKANQSAWRKLGLLTLCVVPAYSIVGLILVASTTSVMSPPPSSRMAFIQVVMILTGIVMLGLLPVCLFGINETNKVKVEPDCSSAGSLKSLVLLTYINAPAPLTAPLLVVTLLTLALFITSLVSWS